MDNLILQSIVRELRTGIVGWPLFRIAAGEGSDLVLLFDDPERRRVLVSDAPALPRLHLTREAVRHVHRPAGFAALASHHLAGAILVSLDKEPAERIVRFRFAGASGPGKSFVGELLGRSSNLLLLDANERILGFSRAVKAKVRKPVAGAVYEPPGDGRRLDPRALTESAVEALAERSHRESHPLADLLLESCPALGALAAREIEHRVLAGESAYPVLVEWLDRAFGTSSVSKESTDAAISTADPSASSATDDEDGIPERENERMSGAPRGEASARLGYVYSEGDPTTLDIRRAPHSGRYLLSPLPLSSAPSDLPRHDYGSLNEAADAYYAPLAAGLIFRAHRDTLVSIAQREAKRAEEVSLKVARELETMQSADRYRVLGESLLAGLSRAERHKDTVTVPDPYASEGETLVIPIDPAMTLPANAERYFRRHRKAERGREFAGKRLEEQRKRSRAMTAVVEQLAHATGREDLEHAEAELRRWGVAVGLERRRPKSPPAPRPVEAGVRLYRSTDGYEILVGKQAEENDRLTFKIAAPEDFWLHASGASGAHVVVRNPRGESRLPAPTLREAAELAAFFSRSKAEKRVDVIVTRRKYVRRVRGAPRGTVSVKKQETVAASPKNPFE